MDWSLHLQVKGFDSLPGLLHCNPHTPMHAGATTVNIQDFVGFVNGQIKFHEHMAEKYKQNPRRAKLHADTLAQFNGLLTALVEARAEIEKLRSQIPEKPIIDWQQLNLRMDEVANLPEELLQELSISDGDWIDYAIISLVEESGGITNVDKLLVGLFKKNSEVHKRNTINSRLYRLVQRGELFNVPGRKGVYSRREIKEEDVPKLN